MTTAVPATAGPAGGWQRGPAPSAAIRGLADRAQGVDGVAPVSGHVLQALDAGTAAWLVPPAAAPHPDAAPSATLPAEAGTPAVSVRVAVAEAVAVAVDADPAEVVVDPQRRGRGLGTALVQAAVQRQGAVWAYGDLPAAARLADRLGLQRSRVLLQLRRSEHLDAPDSAVELPAGVSLRTFVPGRDEEAFLAVNARAFAWHPEQGRLEITGLREEMAQPWFDPEGFFLAVRDGIVVGFHWTKVHAADPTPGAGRSAVQAGAAAPVGEVYVIGVDPDAAIRGLGTPLTAAGLNYLRGRGIGTVMLYVEGDNDRALRLYERYGFTTHLTNVVYSRPAGHPG